MERYRIEPYAPDMLPQVYAIEQASFTDPWSADALAQTAAREDSLFLTVVDTVVDTTAENLCGFDSRQLCGIDAQRICGFGCILTVANEGELVDIAVSPAYRGCGLGQRLMTALLTEAQSRSVEQIFLEVRLSNTPARKLYQKNGFVEIGVRKRYYRDPVEDAVLMQWTCLCNQDKGL